MSQVWEGPVFRGLSSHPNMRGCPRSDLSEFKFARRGLLKLKKLKFLTVGFWWARYERDQFLEGFHLTQTSGGAHGWICQNSSLKIGDIKIEKNQVFNRRILMSQVWEETVFRGHSSHPNIRGCPRLDLPEFKFENRGLFNLKKLKFLTIGFWWARYERDQFLKGFHLTQTSGGAYGWICQNSSLKIEGPLK